jgi:hypothetical protein
MIPPIAGARKLSIPWGAERRRATARRGCIVRGASYRVDARSRHPPLRAQPEMAHQRADFAGRIRLSALDFALCGCVREHQHVRCLGIRGFFGLMIEVAANSLKSISNVSIGHIC